LGVVEMGQFEVMDILKKNRNKWFCVKDFSKMLNISNNCACNSVRKIVNKKDMFGVKVKKGKVDKYFIKL
jgi:prophage antirepressor-like protein